MMILYDDFFTGNGPDVSQLVEFFFSFDFSSSVVDALANEDNYNDDEPKTMYLTWLFWQCEPE